MKRIFYTLFLLLVSMTVQADTLSERLKELGFVESKPPMPNTDDWRRSNSATGFVVEVNKNLTVRLRKEGDYKPEFSFDAGNVKYIGVDHGEFGGGLYINHYKKGTKPFFPGNISALVPMGDDLYIIEGLAHMAHIGGSIHVIRNYRKPSKPVRITLLPDAPEATLIDEINGKKVIVIAGHSSLIILESDSKLRVVHHDTFWGGFYPSSIVKFGDYYVIGMRGGVAATKVKMFEKNEIRYFKPIKR